MADPHDDATQGQLGRAEKIPFRIEGEPSIAGWSQGSGTDVVLCHGLSATSSHVLHGSSFLPRNGYRLNAWDARGHGESDPSPPGEGYSYRHQVDDLDRVVEGLTGGGNIFLAGHSMGSHTALSWALTNPDRVSGLVLIGPVYTDGRELLRDDRWDQRAEALEAGGPEEFARMAAREFSGPEEDRPTIERLARERTRMHRHPEAVAAALREVPRSSPLYEMRDLEGMTVPTIVVGSRDDYDPGHPLAVAEQYSELIPGAELIVEEEGERPLAWQGGGLSRLMASFFGRLQLRENAR